MCEFPRTHSSSTKLIGISRVETRTSLAPAESYPGSNLGHIILFSQFIVTRFNFTLHCPRPSFRNFQIIPTSTL